MGRKISDKLWLKRYIELAEMYLIVYACNKCGSPVNKGYICVFCNNDNPSEET